MNHKGTKTIETKRLILRKHNESDYDNLFNYCFNDKTACEKSNWIFRETKEDLITALKKESVAFERDNYYSWNIFLKDIPIGAIGVTKQDVECEVGYSIHYKHWGKGYASEALQSVIEYLLNEVGFEKVNVVCILENRASKKVMEKAGMTFNKEFIEDNKSKIKFSKKLSN